MAVAVAAVPAVAHLRAVALAEIMVRVAPPIRAAAVAAVAQMTQIMGLVVLAALVLSFFVIPTLSRLLSVLV